MIIILTAIVGIQCKTFPKITTFLDDLNRGFESVRVYGHNYGERGNFRSKILKKMWINELKV